jgi:hypothetical protein
MTTRIFLSVHTLRRTQSPTGGHCRKLTKMMHLAPMCTPYNVITIFSSMSSLPNSSLIPKDNNLIKGHRSRLNNNRILISSKLRAYRDFADMEQSGGNLWMTGRDDFCALVLVAWTGRLAFFEAGGVCEVTWSASWGYDLYLLVQICRAQRHVSGPLPKRFCLIE